MRNKLTYCLLTIAVLLTNYSCQKQQTESQSTKRLNYTAGIKKYISKYARQGGLSNTGKQELSNILTGSNIAQDTPSEQTLGELASASLDVNTTHYIESNIDDSTSEIYNIYETSFIAESGITGSMVSIILPNNKILSYMGVFDSVSSSEFLIHFFYVNGDEIGTVRITNGGFEATSATTPPISPSTSSVRSWWKCTNACIETAVSACNNDPHCNSVAANVNGAWKVFNLYRHASKGNQQVNTPPGGASGGLVGTLIAASCGIHCLKSDTSILPSIDPSDIEGSITEGSSSGGGGP